MHKAAVLCPSFLSSKGHNATVFQYSQQQDFCVVLLAVHNKMTNNKRPTVLWGERVTKCEAANLQFKTRKTTPQLTTTTTISSRAPRTHLPTRNSLDYTPASVCLVCRKWAGLLARPDLMAGVNLKQL